MRLSQTRLHFFPSLDNPHRSQNKQQARHSAPLKFVQPQAYTDENGKHGVVESISGYFGCSDVRYAELHEVKGDQRKTSTLVHANSFRAKVSCIY